jgi:acyl-coenzyme A synthetase/AMP-(fatty) acid ligase
VALLTDLRTRHETVPFARELAEHGDKVALITRDATVTYTELASRVEVVARRLGLQRRLVLLVGANTVDAIVTYLAALAAGHPLLLVPGDKHEAVEQLIAAYRPDVVARPAGGEWVLDERRAGSAHTLHPDLALLLSTSGSTGSPKLVRLSHENLRTNAAAIASYLGIRDTDRAATTLPMYYCYGLSVINSHLLRGAGLVLTDLSVADSCFWDLFRQAGGTAFAGVPYTFDLLERAGFADMRLPHLRYVTQAGGRLAPERVARFAALGRRQGWDLFVMYGQTEATARMAYLPPDLASVRPESIGGPIPGGSFRLDPLPEWPDADVGELVYAGPNVMLGYAESASDLRLGRTVDELHTGDVARRASDGTYELVGRRTAFAKILGVRVDPHQVEAMLERRGVTAACVGGDDELLVALVGDAECSAVRRLVAATYGLPPRAIRVGSLPEIPRLANGKRDHAAIRTLIHPPDVADRPRLEQPSPIDLRALYAEVLERDDVTEDSSFVCLGGDSLSYVEMAVRLEQALGHLPRQWHTTRIRDLQPAAPTISADPSAPPRRARRRTLDTSIALRALSILFIVGSHVPNLLTIRGGAHLLIGVAGFNFARFHLDDVGDGSRTRRLWGAATSLAVPSVIWIGLLYLFADDYRLSNVLLANSIVGPHNGPSEWHFWFIEALLYIFVAMAAILTVPPLRRLNARFPFGFPLGVVAVGLVARYDLFGLRFGGHAPVALSVLWLFALGWAAARANTGWQRLVVTAASLVTIPGFFAAEPYRDALVMAGLVVLIWIPNLPSIVSVNRLAGVLAGASLYIYLIHWQVYPRLDQYSRVLALVAALLAGIACAAATAYVRRRLSIHIRRFWRSARQSRTTMSDRGGFRNLQEALPPV